MNYQEKSTDYIVRDEPAAGSAIREASVSVAEWRFQMSAGNDAFADGDVHRAAAHFQVATTVAQAMTGLADEGRFDARCALRSMSQSHRNLSEAYLRAGRFDDAASTLEAGFIQLCMRACHPHCDKDCRSVCLEHLAQAVDDFVTMLETIQASSARILSVYAMAGQVRARAAEWETAA